MKNNTLMTAIIGISLIAVIYSCSDIIEKNLKNSPVTIVAPGNGIHTSTQTITFFWNTVSGAEQYDLQIVSPNFSAVQNFIIDTTLTANKFTMTLLPGTYQWRVAAINNGGSGPYTTYTLTIDSSSLLTNQVVTLISPANNYTTSQKKILFSWDTVLNSSEYEFQIINSSNVTQIDLLLHHDTISETLANGTYTWQVKAENALSSTAFYSRTLTIDTLPPTIPTLVNPANNDSVANPVHLVWINGPTAIGDSLYVYPDSLVSPPSVTTYTTQLTYAFTGTSGHSYFWRLKAVDAANSVSGYSALSKFIVK